MKRLLLIAAACFCLSACVSHLADLTVISPQSVNLNKVNLNELPQVRNVSGSDYGFSVLFIPLKSSDIKTATKNALKKADADLLIDGSIDETYFWLLFGWSKLTVTGTAVKTRETK